MLAVQKPRECQTDLAPAFVCFCFYHFLDHHFIWCYLPNSGFIDNRTQLNYRLWTSMFIYEFLKLYFFNRVQWKWIVSVLEQANTTFPKMDIGGEYGHCLLVGILFFFPCICSFPKDIQWPLKIVITDHFRNNDQNLLRLTLVY